MSKGVFHTVTDRLAYLVSQLPWWLALILAAFFLFVIAYPFYRRRKRVDLLADLAKGPEGYLKHLSWRDFRYLVEEYFRERGFEVDELSSRSSEGVAFVVTKQRERYLVRCIHGKAATIGKSAVEELEHAVREDGATGGMIVTSGMAADGAKQTARIKKIGLLDGRELQSRIRSQVHAADGASTSKAGGKKAVRLLALVFLTVVLGIAGLVYTEQGRKLQDLAVTQIGRYADLEPLQRWIDSVKRIVVGEEEKEHVFTEEQVEKAMREVLLEKQPQAGNATDEEEKVPRYRYEIELQSGGWVYTDNIDITDGKITYTSRKGLEISLDRDEVKTLKRVRVN